MNKRLKDRVASARKLRTNSKLPEKGVAIIGWKRCTSNRKSLSWEIPKDRLVKLLIPATAERYDSSTLKKCRCSQAVVLDVIDQFSKKRVGVAYSIRSVKHRRPFTYKVGRTVRPERAFSHKAEACASGIHFFRTLKEASEYFAF